MNKKGFIWTIPFVLTFASIILVSVLLAMFTFSGKMRYIIIGAGFIISAIWLLGKAFIAEGELAKNKLIIVLILLAVGAFFMLGNGLLPQNVLGGYVNLPQYSSTWCAPCTIGIQNMPVETFKNSNILFSKTASFTDTYTSQNVYIPNGYFMDVSGLITGPSSTSAALTWICAAGVDGSDGSIAGCKQNLISTDSYRFKLEKGETLYIRVAALRTINVAKSYQPFCLFTLDRQLSTYSSCSKSTLSSLVQDMPDNIPDMIPTGQSYAIENVVIGYTPTGKAVDVVNGKYLDKNGPNSAFRTCPLTTDTSGDTYVDMLHCVVDSSIKCLPSLPPTGYICNEGTSLTKISSGSDCIGEDRLLGFRIIDDKNCELKCISGKQIIGTCNAIEGMNAGIYDSGLSGTNDTLTCNPTFQTLVKAEDIHYKWYNYLGFGTPDKTPKTYCATQGWVYAIIGGVVFLFLVVIIIALAIPKTSKGRKK